MLQPSANLLDTDILPQFIHDYLSGNENLKPFYGNAPKAENFAKQIQSKQFDAHKRKVLVSVLQKQYHQLTTTEKTTFNIQSLLNENTFTVTTAHQANVFTGPLYYIYKILHAVKLADALQAQYPSNNFVPVYWMGCEDHDFDEVNHFHLFGEKIEWLDRQGGAVGRHQSKSLTELLIPVRSKIGNEPFVEEVMSIFEKGYGEYETVAKATQYIVNELFGKYGLVVINPDELELKKLFAPIVKDELANQSVIKHANSTIEKLEALGYKIQAQPRDINLFYLEENIRERIVCNLQTNQYEVLNTTLTFSKESLLAIVDSNPEKFSPNVFLRPLYQETVLPNLAYVGGAGELSYWLEQKEIFDFFNTAFPILMLRNSFTLIDSSTEKKITKLNLPVTDFFQDEDTIIKNYLAQNNNLPDFSNELNKLENVYSEIKIKAEAIDPTLKSTADAQLQQALNNIDSLEKKLTRAIKQQQETAMNQIKAIRNKLMPENKLQERHDNFIPYAASKGLTYTDEMYKAVQPFQPVMIFL
jgi:bacillithiol biosynthesis cysteine-adding enzyme BshC